MATGPMIGRRAVVAGMAALPAAAVGATFPASLRPRRIVSLNPCIDAVLVRVADRGQIAALSHYSRDRASSTIAGIADTFPITYGSAEEVIALRPDLLLDGRSPPPALRQALDRLGIASGVFGVPERLSASLAQVRGIAGLAGQRERGERLVREIELAIANARPEPGSRRPSALIFMPGGFASGPGTLMDEMMAFAGLDNAATRYGLSRSMNVALEQIVADPPDLILSGGEGGAGASRAERLLEHPVLAAIANRTRRVLFPQRLLFCGGPVLIDTARVLARARRSVLEARG